MEGEHGRQRGGRKVCRRKEVVRGWQMQEVSLKWQAVRNLNSNVKAMESKRRVSHGGGKPLWLQWEG